MPRVCQITGAKVTFGHRDPPQRQSQERRRYRQAHHQAREARDLPEPPRQAHLGSGTEQWVKVRLTARALKTINKNGAYPVLLKAGLIKARPRPKKKAAAAPPESRRRGHPTPAVASPRARSFVLCFAIALPGTACARTSPLTLPAPCTASVTSKTASIAKASTSNRSPKKHGTPLYVYSKETITDHFTRLDQARRPLDHLICYAVKANSNLAVLHTIAELGGGFDIVSGGELFRVLKAGGTAAQMHLCRRGQDPRRNRVCPARRHLLLQCRVAKPNCATQPDRRRTRQKGARRPARESRTWTPSTHANITTGKSENKFGIEFERVADAYAAVAKDCPHLEIRGVQMHIGSQLTSIEPFVEGREEGRAARAGAEGTAITCSSSASAAASASSIARASTAATPPGGATSRRTERPLTIGRPTPTRWCRSSQPLKLRILLEPGRFMVGNAGALLTRVLYLKQGGAKKFVIVDAGMNDLIRPALYEGWHQIAPLKKPASSDAGKSRRGRPHLRNRRLPRPGPRTAAGERGRHPRRAQRRRLRLHHGVELQLAPPARGNPGGWRQSPPGAPAPDLGRFDPRRSHSAGLIHGPRAAGGERCRSLEFGLRGALLNRTFHRESALASSQCFSIHCTVRSHISGRYTWPVSG